jgi:protein-disulfide isomerase
MLSPDHRFLSRELLDSTVDPVDEERRRRKDFREHLDGGDFPMRGGRGAAVTLTVFSDFQCPYCSRFATMIEDQVLRKEGTRVRLVFRNLPLSMHNWAYPAAVAGVCAREQGDGYFWKLHDSLFGHQSEITASTLAKQVSDTTAEFGGFDQKRFKACLVGKPASALVERDVQFARDNGITATPTLFINGEPVPNVVAVEQIRSLIREAAMPEARVQDRR